MEQRRQPDLEATAVLDAFMLVARSLVRTTVPVDDRARYEDALTRMVDLGQSDLMDWINNAEGIAGSIYVPASRDRDVVGIIGVAAYEEEPGEGWTARVSTRLMFGFLPDGAIDVEVLDTFLPFREKPIVDARFGKLAEIIAQSEPLMHAMRIYDARETTTGSSQAVVHEILLAHDNPHGTGAARPGGKTDGKRDNGRGQQGFIARP